jgi:hypothetical protein
LISSLTPCRAISTARLARSSSPCLTFEIELELGEFCGVFGYSISLWNSGSDWQWR